MHLFGHSFDHDYYFELPSEGERDTQSVTRCLTSHHRDVQVVPRANRTFSPARNPIACASSSKGEPPVFVPWPPWRFSVRAASSGGHTYSAIPEGRAPSLAPLPPAGNVIAVGADRDFPSSVPRSVESHPSAASAECVGHPDDPSSACVLASSRSRWRPRPQLNVQFRQQSLEPARMPAGFHPHAHFHSLRRQVTVELLRFLTMPQSALLQFPGFGIYKSNLLRARLIICSYNRISTTGIPLQEG